MSDSVQERVAVSRAAGLAGLTEREARAKLAVEGPNSLPSQPRRSLPALVLDVLREPMLVLLVGAGLVYLFLGDLLEALMLLAFACFSVIVSIVQQGRTDRAIEALGRLATPTVTVIRDGVAHPISALDLVRGDIMTIGEGDRIAADGWLVSADDLQVDESVLTGESVPVGKRSNQPADKNRAPPPPGGDGLPYAFSGTLAVRGNGVMLVAATGAHTRIGMIGRSLRDITTEAPRLTVETRQLVRWSALFALVTSVAAAGLYASLRGGWVDAVLVGIALSMSLLPEELPVVLTLYLAMGALRLSRARVLARRGAAIESLGAATVLCTDKTGTLTHNRMSIAELRLPSGQRFVPHAGERVVLPPAFVELAGLGVLASLEQPFDPMETAFHDLATLHGGEEVNWRQEAGWTLQRQYPLHPDLLAVSHVWGGDGEERVVAAKGAPEAIAEMCAMTDAERSAMERETAEMAAEGLRVLGIAEARWSGAELPARQSQFTYAYRGLVGLADPIRPAVRPAIAELIGAGVRVIMITGDYPATALAIATMAGIPHGLVMTGPELAALDESELNRQVKSVSVFARIAPDQKVRIVEALKANGEVVAMIGDGVNDAPSLKAAHIGVAMGKRGTDVARAAAAIVLLDDDFAAVPAAVRLGRRIYDNLRKAAGFILAVHVPIAGLALAPLVLGWPIILGPMHIATLEMIIDPVSALAFEAEEDEPGIMRRAPRDPGSTLIPRSLLAWSAVQGMTALGALLALAAWAFGPVGFEAGQARTIVFGGLVVAVLMLVIVNRTFAGTAVPRLRRNIPLLAILVAAVAFMAAVLSVPPLASAFSFGPLPAPGAAAIGALAVGLVGLLLVLRSRFASALTH